MDKSTSYVKILRKAVCRTVTEASLAGIASVSSGSRSEIRSLTGTSRIPVQSGRLIYFANVPKGDLPGSNHTPR
jgi:hypothetical protein